MLIFIKSSFLVEHWY